MTAYWWRILRRAFGESINGIGFDRRTAARGVGITILVGAFQVMFHSYRAGGYAAADLFEQLVSFGYATTIVLAGLVVWYVARVASEFDRERCRKIDKLNAEIESLKEVVADKKADTNVIDGLELLHSRGEEIYNTKNPTDSKRKFDKWREQILGWDSKTQEILDEGMPRSESFGFRSLAKFPEFESSRPSTTDHAHSRKYLREKLDKLRLIIMRHSGEIQAKAKSEIETSQMP